MSFTLNATLDLSVLAAAFCSSAGTAFAAWRHGRKLNRVAANTEQLRHNGGSHVADYARDARDNSAEALRKVDRVERLAERMVEKAQQAGELARDARGAAARAASISKDTQSDLESLRGVVETHIQRGDEVEVEIRDRLDDIANRRTA